jgi:hypothetical protein
MSCWTVFHYVAAPVRATVHHTAHIARHVWRGKGARTWIHSHLHVVVTKGAWKTAIVCTVTAVGGLGGLGGAHLVGVPFPPVTGHQLVDALCCGGGFGGGPSGWAVGPAGERREATWASGVTGGLAGYPDRPVRKVPEPASLLLLATGIVAIAAVRRRT